MCQNKRKFFRTIVGVFCFVSVCLLLGATMVFGAEPGPSAPEVVTTGIPGTSDMDTLTAIFTRRSVRKYSDKPVSDATVKLLLQAAM